MANEITARATKIPSIPSVSSKSLVSVASAMKQILDVREGRADPLDKALTLRDLYKSGVVKINVNGVLRSWSGGNDTGIEPGVDPGTAQETVVPPAPTNLQATTGFSTVFLSWDAPAYSGHSYAEIWRSSTDDIGTATKVGSQPGVIGAYADAVGFTGASYYYWVRFVSTSGDAGAYNAVSGVFASTGYIGTADLTDLIITAQKIADGEIDLGGAKITGLLADTNLAQIGDATKIADSLIGDTKLAAGAVTATKIADGEIDLGGAKITGLLADTNLAQIGDATKIADGLIGNAKLASGAVTAAKIANGEIDLGGAKVTGLLSNTNLAQITDATKIADALIDNTKLANLAVTAAKLANGAVDWQTKVSGTGKPADSATTDIKFIASANMAIQGNSAVKTGGVAGWNEQIYSASAWEGTAYVEFTPDQADKNFVIGINTDPTTSADQASIDYAWFCRSDGTAFAYQSGVATGNHGAYSADTVFAIVYDGQNIKYYMDGVLKETVAVASNSKFYLDSSFSDVAASASNIKFGPYGRLPSDADEVPESGTRKWAGETGADVTSGNPQSLAWLTDGANIVQANDSLTRLIDRTADNIAESTARKWAAESGADVTSSNKALSVETPDTRSTNELPSYYRALGRGLYPEFKETSVMGVGAGTYGFLVTAVKWQATSGGRVTQEFYDDDDVKYRRRGSSDDTAWESWVKSFDEGSKPDLGSDILNAIADNIGETGTRKWAGESGADVTLNNTAASISGQGAFATLSQINGSNITTYIANAAIQSAQVANAAIGTAAIQNAAITNALIANLAVGTAQIADAAITSIKIGSAAVGTANIQTAAITTALIANLAVGSGQIADAAITNAKIGSAAVGTANIQTAGITTALIANAAIGSAQIADAAITSAKIENLAVGTAAVDNLAITSAKINDVAADKITAGTITAAISITSPDINGGTIDGAVITGSTLQTAGSGKRFVASSVSNNAVFYGDRGDTTVAALASFDLLANDEGTAILTLGDGVNTDRQGVFIDVDNALGVYSVAKSNTAVKGVSQGGTGIGVLGQGVSYGVYGEASGSGGVGVFGTSLNSSGIGGVFNGGASGAQIALTPASSGAAPSHSKTKGSLFLNSDTHLYINTNGGSAWGYVPHSRSGVVKGSKTMGGFAYWYPPPGFYNFMIPAGAGGETQFQIHDGSTWQENDTEEHAFFAWCDGSNMRFYNTHSGNWTFYYQKMGD